MVSLSLWICIRQYSDSHYNSQRTTHPNATATIETIALEYTQIQTHADTGIHTPSMVSMPSMPSMTTHSTPHTILLTPLTINSPNATILSYIHTHTHKH